MADSRRRLVFAIHDLNPWGGHDRSTLEIARRLSHRWPVDIYSFTLEDPFGEGQWGDYRFHRIKPHLSRPVAAKILWYYGATWPGFSIAPRLRNQERPLIHATGACSLVADVIQVQFVSAAWKSEQTRLPPEVCAPPHSRGKSGVGNWIRRIYHNTLLDFNVAAEKRIYTQDKTYIAIARGVAQELKDHFGVVDHVHVIHHGVDSKAFRPGTESDRPDLDQLRASWGVKPNELVVLFVGAFERKGLAVAIDAVARLPEDLRNQIRLVAVGGGATEGFKRKAASLGIGDRIVLAGHSKDIAPIYRACDIFLMPTLYEPFGLVILEAMSSGLACLVSRLAGASELIVEGKSGSLIQDPTSADAISGQLANLLRDRQMRTKISEGAREVALARSWDQVASEYAQVLERQMEKGV